MNKLIKKFRKLFGCRDKACLWYRKDKKDGSNCRIYSREELISGDCIHYYSKVYDRRKR